MLKYDYILWDWNGTLLDDAEMNLEVMRSMLKKRGVTSMPTKEFYLEHFAFPIIGFYEKVGFDLSSLCFDDVAKEYVEEYEKRLSTVSLFENAKSTLAALNELGARQAVISATGHERLGRQVSRFEISSLFDAVLGTQNELGHGKTDVALRWLEKSGADPTRVVFIGDTLHDFETAGAIGCDCVLVARGHNSKERLLRCGCPVLEDISQTLKELTL